MSVENSTIERVARESFGRLLAFLTSRTGDWAAAEDALADAFQSALEAWPAQGIPLNPEAWLLVVARRRLSDKHQRDVRYAEADFTQFASEAEQNPVALITDERLCMLFLCVHPAIDASLHTPLMLQAVFGMSAERIASVFLVRPATMGQRLSRAKSKIKQAGIRFIAPEGAELRSRLKAVLEAIYAAYSLGWEALERTERPQQGLAGEAIFLGRILAELLPDEPEVHGLLSLMLYCDSRTSARRTTTGVYVPLAEQDISLWCRDLIGEAEQHLARASAMGRPGRFQMEAAIQSAHTFRLATGFTDWSVIVELYRGLMQFCSSTGVRLAYIAAIGEATGAQNGLELLLEMPADRVVSHQPYWALRAHLESRTGLDADAQETYQRAIGLSDDASVRDHLICKSLLLKKA